MSNAFRQRGIRYRRFVVLRNAGIRSETSSLQRPGIHVRTMFTANEISRSLSCLVPVWHD